jgi:hypothetical protein
MKRFFYFLVLLTGLSYTAFAQQEVAPAIPQNIIGLKMAFVTKQLALTNEEAQKFWPVYYSYTNEIRSVKKQQKDDVLSMEEDMLNVRKKYRTEFKKILNTDERVNKALTVDRDFMSVVRKELQERARNRGKQKDKDQN